MERNKKLPIKRPMPPKHIGQLTDGEWNMFVPAPELLQFVSDSFIGEDKPLYNEDHNHLIGADIAFLWAPSGFETKQRFVIGQCEEVTFRCGPWQKARQEQQMIQWFGHVPEFLITVDAKYCEQASDADFCALLEHELYHIGQKLDGFAQPKFTKSGHAALEMRGHDVEEFIGIVQRYGVGNPNGATARFVKAANSKPTVSKLALFHACGTCLLRAA